MRGVSPTRFLDKGAILYFPSGNTSTQELHEKPIYFHGNICSSFLNTEVQAQGNLRIFSLNPCVFSQNK